ncbi:efflux transporter outer membrane subunit [uncultured Acinetobacter sp.]|uniref:efflux transporter outer membrane subunit n=1 Tax=uncultured Acinetobacter sp. TaxID=165433 RepID=UPI00258E40A8|nr:efflux transporter outer membrane subunit [uncultured Acinetobacter sp.]
MPSSKLTTLCAMLVASSTLVGCAAMVKTPYHAPAVQTPSSFQYDKTQVASNYANYADRWWTLFGDTQLNQLVDQVIAKNTDLAVAGITLRQARLKAGLAADQQGPRVNSNISSSQNIDVNSGDRSSNGLSLNAGVSYELDLFGKLARQTEAAKWEALATAQDLQATAQTLIGTTTKLYWQLAYLNESLSTAQQSLATSEKLYSLVNTQYQAGAVSGLDLTQAEQSVQSQKANLSQIQQSLVETRTALAVLLHIPVQQLNIQEPQRLPQVNLPQIQAGLPASILSRRPDLRVAELRLRETLATKDATTASYYPSISLTGSLGSSSTSLTELIKNPVLALGANLSLPFLQYNDMKKNIAISQLDYEKAIIQYRQTLYQAFADVENALSARTELNQQVQFQQRNLELAEKAERLTDVRYRNGAIALKNVLDQQQTTRTARLSLVNTKQSQYNAYVTLMQALGGSPIQ